MQEIKIIFFFIKINSTRVSVIEEEEEEEVEDNDKLKILDVLDEN